MADVIDIHDLPAEDVKFIEKLVMLLREKAKIKKVDKEPEREEIKFAAWPLGAKGKLTRSEIYDCL